MPVTPPFPHPNDFVSAAANLRALALDQFATAFAKVNVTPPQPAPATATAEQKEAAKNLIAAYGKAQSEMAAAFKQIGDVDRQVAERAGYESVVALMKTTATAAEDVRAKIKAVTDALPTITSTSQQLGFQTYQVNQLTALTAVLTALAALSLAETWQTSPVSGGGA